MTPLRHGDWVGLVSRALPFAAIALLATGCVVLPVPTNRLGPSSRRDIPVEVRDKLVAGCTTREEVLLQLGEPDEWSGDRSSYRYHWERVKWDIFWAVGGQGGGACGDIPINKNYDLMIAFDPADVISQRRFSERFHPSELEDPRRALP